MTWYFPRLGVFVPQVRRRCDLSDRQDQSRRAAHRAFSVAGGGHGVVCAARLAAVEIAGVLAGDRVRAAFAGDFLPRRVSGLCRALRVHRSVQPPARCRSSSAWSASSSWSAWRRWFRGIERVERQGPGPRPPAIKAGLRGGRRMRGAFYIRAGIRVLAAPARHLAEQPAECRVAAADLIERRFSAAAGRARDRAKQLRHPGGRRRFLDRCRGRTAPRTPIRRGCSTRSPTKLPGVAVKVTTDVKAKRTAAEMVKTLAPAWRRPSPR